jgi:hypothetical protein
LINKVVLLLQNCINLLKVVPGSYNDTSVTSSHDGNQVLNIKSEVTGDPELITFPVVKAEHEVSCTAVCSLVSELKMFETNVVHCRGRHWCLLFHP